ncbi:MAG: hypothetical protein ABI927_00690 [Gaiellaceae bacterium]
MEHVYRARYRQLAAIYLLVFAMTTATGAVVFGLRALALCLIVGVLAAVIQVLRRTSLVALARTKCEREVGKVSTVRANAIGGLLLLPTLNALNVAVVVALVSDAGERRVLGVAVSWVFAFASLATSVRYAIGTAATQGVGLNGSPSEQTSS